MDEIKPALTPEQWALVLDGRLDARDWSWVGAPRGTPGIDEFGMAAALLHGHFTREDVDLIRALASWIPPEWRQKEGDFRAVADRIAALLPPREP